MPTDAALATPPSLTGDGPGYSVVPSLVAEPSGMDWMDIVHDALGQVEVPDSFATEAEAAAFIASTDRAQARLAALRLRAVARAERSKVAESRGANGTSAWLAQQSRATGASAAQDVRLATALAAGLPATGAALSDGEVSAEHAKVIAHAVQSLPDRLRPEEVDAVEVGLVARAGEVDPATLRKEARRALEHTEATLAEVDAHHDQLLRTEEDRAVEKTRLSWHDNRDGTISGQFTVPTLAGHVLIKTVQALTSPRRRSIQAAQTRRATGGNGGNGGNGTGGAGGGETSTIGGIGNGGAGGGDMSATGGIGNGGAGTPGATMGDAAPTASDRPLETDWKHEYGLAFAQLLEHLPTEGLHTKTAATVLVTMTHQELMEGLDYVPGPAASDTGHELSAGEARRIACNAGLLPVVLGGDSMPVDVGSAQRYFTEHQRRALAVTYDTCAAAGCDRPYAWTELHHLLPWSVGGPTDLANAVPLCWQDHRRIHDPRYAHSHTRDPDGRLTVRFRVRE